MAGFRLHLFKQPLAGIPPHALHRAKFKAHDLRGFLVSQSKKVLQLHKLAPLRPMLREIMKEPVHRDRETDSGAIGGNKRFQFFKPDELGIRSRPPNVNQVPSHCSKSFHSGIGHSRNAAEATAVSESETGKTPIHRIAPENLPCLLKL
jgi:hypothetical protein